MEFKITKKFERMNKKRFLVKIKVGYATDK